MNTEKLFGTSNLYKILQIDSTASIMEGKWSLKKISVSKLIELF